jgi:hypothetical protein
MKVTREDVDGMMASVGFKPVTKSTKHKPKSYNPDVVTAFFAEHGIPAPKFEFPFHPTRKWRFDIAWPWPTNNVSPRVAIECDGGIWIRGGHNRGAQMKADWEKANEAMVLGWRILRCEPKDLCTNEFAELVRRALKL